MNFLQLCQQTAQWSGKAAAASITSVVAASGVQLDIVNAVSQAWSVVQTAHNNWQWLRAEFSSTISAVAPPTQARYTAASFGITRFADWVYDQIAPAASGGSTYRAMTLIDPTIGYSDEQVIAYIEWEVWRARYARGLQTQSRPTEWTADPSGNFCIGKVPNKTYTLNGEYFKDVQILANPTDLPEAPAKYHMIIVWRAALLLMEKDEADQLQYSRYENKADEMMLQLERDQLPHITIGGSPIA